MTFREPIGLDLDAAAGVVGAPLIAPTSVHSSVQLPNGKQFRTTPVVVDTLIVNLEVELSEAARLAFAVGDAHEAIEVAYCSPVHADLELCSTVAAATDYVFCAFDYEKDCSDFGYISTYAKGYRGYGHQVRGHRSHDGIVLFVSQGRETTKAKLKLSSEVLWKEAGKNTKLSEVVAAAIAQLVNGGAIISYQVVSLARLDVCVDLFGSFDVIQDINNFVTRSVTRGRAGSADFDDKLQHFIFSGRHSKTLYIGARSSESTFLRIYDKKTEAQLSGKIEWLSAIWKQFGWNGAQSVYRVEFEVGGGWLKNHGFSYDQIDNLQFSLWEILTENTRLVLPTESNLRRCQLDPRWSAVQQAVAKERSSWRWISRKFVSKLGTSRLLKVASTYFKNLRERLFNSPNNYQDNPDINKGFWQVPGSRNTNLLTYNAITTSLYARK